MLLIVGFSVLSVVLLIAVIVCIVKMNKLYRRYDLFMRGKDAETLEDTLEDILEELKESQSRDRASKDAMKPVSYTHLNGIRLSHSQPLDAWVRSWIRRRGFPVPVFA